MDFQFFDESDPDDQVRRQAFQAEIETIERRGGDELDDQLRQIGLYVGHKAIGHVHSPFGPKPALIVTANVGEVAFAARTIAPEDDVFDRQFRDIKAQAEVDDFVDAREEIKRRLESGDDFSAD